VTFRDKYVEITTHLLLEDAGKLSFNFISALDFFILLARKKFKINILTHQNLQFAFFATE
jgi:hypothetical protein